MTEAGTGALVQRLLDIETYPHARHSRPAACTVAVAEIRRTEDGLTAVTQRMKGKRPRGG